MWNTFLSTSPPYSVTRFHLDLCPRCCYDLSMRLALTLPIAFISLITASAQLSYAASLVMAALHPSQRAQNAPSESPEQADTIMPPEDLLKRAQSGDTDAQVELGYFYSNPENPDHLSMYTWFLKAARAENLEAQATVGFLILEGIGTPAHPPTALLWLEAAAERGDTESQLMLATIFLNASHGISRDLERAFKYFKLASSSGSAQAQLMLAICYENGIGCEVNHELALEYAKKSAAQLDPQALCMLGDLARKNVPHGTKIDRATVMPALDPIARGYYLHAAFLGEKKANYELAKAALQESGKQRSMDSEEKKRAVVALLEHATMEGYAPAMYELGLCYSWGYGVEKDEQYAADLIAEAAAHGYEPARYMMVYLHTIGQGVDYSLSDAYEWLHAMPRG